MSNLADVAQIVPGLTFSQTANDTPVYTLRGVGFFESTLAAYPDVSVYLDQVPLPFPTLTSLTAFDLDRLEVLKGPQGTLFGQNSTGGAINYIAAKPTSDLSAGGSLSYGRFDTVELEGFLSGPLTNTLRVRLAGRVARGDEWQKSHTRDDRLGKKDTKAIRFLADWKPSERLSFELNLNAWQNKSDPQAPQAIAIVQQNAAIPSDYPALNIAFAPAGSVAKIVKLEHAWRRLDGRNDDGFQVAPFPG
ncbi:TonB-dependent receptor plug domain-containing protein [Sphingobium herbicidovorans]|nr:TonB-dependent receptor plug domain-containing protein [Sphingobium sp. MI1205]